MRGAKSRVLIAVLGVGLLAVATGAAPASGAIKVTRDDPSNVLAEFRQVNCQFKNGKPVAFQAIGRAGGWAFRATIYANKMKKDHGYEVEYGDDSRADVFVFPPSGPRYTNMNEPQPGGMDVFGSAGGVVLKKKGNDFGAGLPIIYDGTGPNPNYVTVTGYADCK